MAVLVTGGCGYIGTRLTEALLSRTHHDVTVVDTAWFGNYLPTHPRLRVEIADIRAIDGLDLSGFDSYCSHGRHRERSRRRSESACVWEVNVLATMQWSIEPAAGREAVRLPSSGAVCGVRSRPRVTEIWT